MESAETDGDRGGRGVEMLLVGISLAIVILLTWVGTLTRAVRDNSRRLEQAEEHLAECEARAKAMTSVLEEQRRMHREIIAELRRLEDGRGPKPRFDNSSRPPTRGTVPLPDDPRRGMWGLWNFNQPGEER